MKKGFTLIELMIVVAIIAILTGLSLSNFLGARERASDVKKKSEMNELKKALRLYYNDYQTYPADDSAGGINGCGPTGTDSCATACNDVFAAGGATGCSTVYMKRLPNFSNGAQDATNGYTYARVVGGEDFLLKIKLDNVSDPDITASRSQCATAACGADTGYYCVCSE